MRKREFAKSLKKQWGKLFWVLRTMRGKVEGEREQSGHFFLFFFFFLLSPPTTPTLTEYFLTLSFESGTGPSTCLIFFRPSQQASG